MVSKSHNISCNRNPRLTIRVSHLNKRRLQSTRGSTCWKDKLWISKKYSQVRTLLTKRISSVHSIKTIWNLAFTPKKIQYLPKRTHWEACVLLKSKSLKPSLLPKSSPNNQEKLGPRLNPNQSLNQNQNHGREPRNAMCLPTLTNNRSWFRRCRSRYLNWLSSLSNCRCRPTRTKKLFTWLWPGATNKYLTTKKSNRYKVK